MTAAANDREVLGCVTCPGFQAHQGVYSCALFKGRGNQSNRPELERRAVHANETPDWCPLRQGPVTLRLRVAT